MRGRKKRRRNKGGIGCRIGCCSGGPYLDALPLAQPGGLGPCQGLEGVFIEDVGHEPREVCALDEALEVLEAKVKVVVPQAGCVDAHGVQHWCLQG